jgi:hypothetical protein
MVSNMTCESEGTFLGDVYSGWILLVQSFGSWHSSPLHLWVATRKEVCGLDLIPSSWSCQTAFSSPFTSSPRYNAPRIGLSISAGISDPIQSLADTRFFTLMPSGSTLSCCLLLSLQCSGPGTTPFDGAGRLAANDSLFELFHS